MTLVPDIPATSFVIPAQAGIQTESMPGGGAVWIPAFAGMTVVVNA